MVAPLITTILLIQKVWIKNSAIYKSKYQVSKSNKMKKLSWTVTELSQ